MRLIDADALLDHQFKNDISYNAFRSLVKRQATIDAVPVKHGEWIYTKKRLVRGGYVDASECSICRKRIMPHLRPNYCPNCGAKMDGGKDDG